MKLELRMWRTLSRQRVLVPDDLAGAGNNESDVVNYTLVKKLTDDPVVKVPWKVEGTASVTGDFRVTFTADDVTNDDGNLVDAVLNEDDIDKGTSTIVGFGKDPDASAGNKTVYVAVIRPHLFATTITVTIKSSATTAEPAAAPNDKVTATVGEATITAISTVPATANDQADFEVIFTFDKALRTSTSLMLEHLSIGTMNSATDTTKNDMTDGNMANDAVVPAVADPIFLGTPNRVPGETMKWRVRGESEEWSEYHHRAKYSGAGKV